MGDFVHNVVARGAGLPVALPVEPGPRAPLPGIADPGALAHEGGQQEIPRPAELRVDEDSSAPAAASPPAASHEASTPAPTLEPSAGPVEMPEPAQPRCRQPRRRLTQRRWRTRSRCWTGRRCWTRRRPRPRRAVRRSRLRRLLPAPRSRSNPSRQAPSSSPSVRRRDHPAPARSRHPFRISRRDPRPHGRRPKWSRPRLRGGVPPPGPNPRRSRCRSQPPSRSRRRPGRCPGPPPTPARRRRSAEASVPAGPVEPAPTPSLHAPTREPRDAGPTEPLRPAAAAAPTRAGRTPHGCRRGAEDPRAEARARPARASPASPPPRNPPSRSPPRRPPRARSRPPGPLPPKRLTPPRRPSPAGTPPTPSPRSPHVPRRASHPCRRPRGRPTVRVWRSASAPSRCAHRHPSRRWSRRRRSRRMAASTGTPP